MTRKCRLTELLCYMCLCVTFSVCLSHWTAQCVCVRVCVCVPPVAQTHRDEGSGPGKWETQGPADVQENVLLHHAGRHAAATPHRSRGHDGETVFWNSVIGFMPLSVPSALMLKHLTPLFLTAAGFSQLKAGWKSGSEEKTGELNIHAENVMYVLSQAWETQQVCEELRCLLTWVWVYQMCPNSFWTRSDGEAGNVLWRFSFFWVPVVLFFQLDWFLEDVASAWKSQDHVFLGFFLRQ